MSLLAACKRSHPYSGDNLYLWKGRRYCRACRADYATTRPYVNRYVPVTLPHKTGPPSRSMSDRLLARSDRQPNGCLLWNGAIGSSGYGQTHSSAPRRQVLVHRAAYEVWVGPIPAGLQIDHLCRTRICIEPTHLEAVTARENVLRSELVASAQRRPTCKAGHLWTETTTYRAKGGARVCRICHRQYMRARYQPRKKAAA